MGKDELCCGDSLRRLGNEYVFDRMVKSNAKLFSDKGVKKIITQCPHCFTTIKNDYRQYGLELEVQHHSELLADLLAWSLRAQDPLPLPRHRYVMKTDPRNYWAPYR